MAPVHSGNTRHLCSLQPHVTSAHVCFSGNIRISDLGLAVELKEGQTKTKGYAGTPGKGLRARVGKPVPGGEVRPWGSWGSLWPGVRGKMRAGVSQGSGSLNPQNEKPGGLARVPAA